MKKLRILFLVFVIILLSGCSGTYNLKINEDFSIDENLNVNIENKNNSYEKTKELFDNNDISKDKYKITVTNKNITINYNESYSSIEEYILNSKLYPQMFNDVKYKYNDGILSFKTDSKMLLQDNGSSSLFNNYNISMFQINVESPFIVKNSTADIENEDTLSWTFTKETTSKNISIEYDAEGSRSKLKDIIVISLIVIISVGSIVVVIIRFNKSRKI